MFDSIPSTAQTLTRHAYVPDEALATSLFLALRMGMPLFLEGEPGVGKTELAKVLALALDTELIRLQCHEGLDVSQALYEWNYPRQLLAIQARNDAFGPLVDHSVDHVDDLFSESFLLRRPLLQAIAALRWQASERRTRRQRPARRGPSIDLRRALRHTARQGSVPAQLPRRRAKIKPRPVVLLADISGSMTTYSRLLLLFFHSVTRSLGRVESFVFGTRLTRVTPALALRNVDRALQEAAHQVIDWEGGTRIADSLARFRRRWSKRLLNRGAVVVVSDGCEPCANPDDARRLGDEVARLRRRCHRLIWLNPRLGAPGYAPRVAGMAAALPAIDDFLAIHNLDSLHQLAAQLRALPARRSSARSGSSPIEPITRRLPA